MYDFISGYFYWEFFLLMEYSTTRTLMANLPSAFFSFWILNAAFSCSKSLYPIRTCSLNDKVDVQKSGHFFTFSSIIVVVFGLLYRIEVHISRNFYFIGYEFHRAGYHP